MGGEKGEACEGPEKKEWEGCVNLLQQGSAVPYNWFLPVIRELKRLSFLMTDKTSVSYVPWKPHIEINELSILYIIYI